MKFLGSNISVGNICNSFSAVAGQAPFIYASDPFDGTEQNLVRWTNTILGSSTVTQAAGKLDHECVANAGRPVITELNKTLAAGEDFYIEVDISGIAADTSLPSLTNEQGQLILVIGGVDIIAGVFSSSGDLPNSGRWIQVGATPIYAQDDALTTKAIIKRVGSTVTIISGSLTTTTENAGEVTAIQLQNRAYRTAGHTANVYFDDFLALKSEGGPGLKIEL